MHIKSALSSMALLAASFAAAAPGHAEVPAAAPAAPPGAAAVDPNKIYTMEDLNIAFRDKDYRVILQQISKIQPNKKLMTNYLPYDLEMLKAETYLRLRMNVQALDTYALAAKDAPNAISAAVAQATGLLLRRSQNLQYTVRHPAAIDPARHTAQVYDLTNMDLRKDVLIALHHDEEVEIVAKATAAERSTSLLPIAAVAKPLDDLEILELAATGANTYVAQERNKLAALGGKLIKSSLDQMSVSVLAIRQSAEKFVEVWFPTPGAGGRVLQERHYKQRGLFQNDITTLQSVKANAARIEPAATELGLRLRQEPTAFAALALQAQRLALQADSILTTDYSTLDPLGSPLNRR